VSVQEPSITGAAEEPIVVDLLDTSAAGPVAARGGAMRAMGYAVGTLLGVISAPLLIRHLGVEDFGRYVTVLSLVTIVAGLTEAGLNAIALREYVSRKGAERERIMRDLLGIRIALTLAGVAFGVVFAIVAGYPSVLVLGTLVVGAGLLLQSLQTLLGVALQGELRFGWVTAIDVLRQLLVVALVVALIFARADLAPFFYAPIPGIVLALIATAGLVRSLMPLRPSFQPAHWWPLLRGTIAYAAAVALNAAYFRIAIIALSLLATELQTGYFATAFRIIEMLIAVPALLLGAAFPILVRAARDNPARLDSATSRLIEVALILGVWLALGIALAAQPIISLLAGGNSDPSVGLLRIQSFALIATFVSFAAGYALLSLHRHRTILAANAAALASTLVLTVVLVPRYGATGAAIAVLAAEFTLGSITLGALVRVRPAVSETLRRAPAVLVAGGLAGLVVLLPGVPPLGDAGLAAVAYPALLVVVRRFPPEVGHALR
jgi:O-antigen/teichoic acid export membrane protein